MKTEMAAVLALGDCFESFKDVENIMKQYERSVYANYYVYDSKKLASTWVTENLSRAANAKAELEFYTVHYRCIHGGRKFKSCSKGVRPELRTVRQGCQSKVRFTLSGDGQYLVVKELVEAHNHALSSEAFNCLPRQRRLNDEEKAEAELLLDLKANKSTVQQHLQVMSGKHVTLTDLCKLVSKRRSRAENQLESTVTMLQADERSIVQVVVTEDSELFGVFYQDAVMQRMFVKFPELFVIEEPFALDELEMLLYVLMVVDGSGQYEIVGTFLATQQDDETIKHVVQLFKSHNAACDSVQTVITYSELIRRQVLTEEFPQATFLVSPSHVLEAFQCDITCENMGITEHQRDECLEILDGIMHSKTMDEYSDKYEQLVETGAISVVDYYNEGWETMKECFVECFCGINLSLLNISSGRTDLIHTKLKSLCSRSKTLMALYHDLKLVCRYLLVDCDHSLMMRKTLSTKSVSASLTLEATFLSILTPFAYGLIKPHLDSYLDVTVDRDIDDRSCQLTCATGGTIITSVDACPCVFRTSLGLPCVHIMVVRGIKSVSVYDDELIAGRWTRQYNLSCWTELEQLCKGVYSSSNSSSRQSEEPTASICDRQHTVPSTYHKYRQAASVALELAALIAEAPDQYFVPRLRQIRLLRDTWLDDRLVTVDEVCENEHRPLNTVVTGEGSGSGGGSRHRIRVNARKNSVTSKVNGATVQTEEMRPSGARCWTDEDAARDGDESVEMTVASDCDLPTNNESDGDVESVISSHHLVNDSTESMVCQNALDLHSIKLPSKLSHTRSRRCPTRTANTPVVMPRKRQKVRK